MFKSLEKHNLSKIIMLTGDKKTVAENIARSVGIRDFRAELLPEQKVEALKEIQKEFGPMAMVGDGVNDAPALAIASVGIAMGSHGATAASEAGDVVIMVNDIHRVHDAVHVAQGAMRLAKQGIYLGMGTSLTLIVFAVFGLITPIAGAVMQEILDAVVILNALRVNFQKID
jgi:P-type E1-E2 ATPase